MDIKVDMTELAELEKYRQKFPKGTPVFSEGDLGYSMYIIHTGKIKISKRVHVVDKTLDILERGDFFGEMAILEGMPRSATATAVEDSELIEIDGAMLEELIAGNAQVGIRMLKEFSRRLREADSQIESLLFRNDTSRIVHTLTKLSLAHGEKRDDGIVVEAEVTDQELADLAGVPVETVNKYLEELERAKLLSREKGQFVIHNLEYMDEFLKYLTWRNKAFR